MIDAFFWFEAGYCTMYDRFARRGGAWQRVRFPAAVGLLHHTTRGWILFDTGYHPRFFEVTQRWPYRLMRYATKIYVQPQETAAAQLKAAGIDVASINHVLLSHVHTDHVAGVADFENSALWLHQHAWQNAAELEGWAAVKQGVVPALLPNDWKQRAQVFEPANASMHPIFGHSWDMFGDGSIEVVSLPGHARGQVGAQFSFEGQTFLLAADAAWNTVEIETLTMPPFPGNLVIHDKQAYLQTLRNLNAWKQQNPGAALIPTHCMRAFNQFQRPLHVV